MRRKGELSPSQIDRRWPQQVMLAQARTDARVFEDILAYCKATGAAPRTRSLVHDDEWYNVYCFAEAGHASGFIETFGGETVNPKGRGKGANWAIWHEG